MGFQTKIKNIKEEPTINEINHISEIDKLKKYTKEKLSQVSLLYSPIIKLLDKYYEDGISDYTRCKSFIDLCNKNEKELLLEIHSLETIFHLCMVTENTDILLNLITLVLNLESDRYNYIKYIVDSRSYFTDYESWYIRVYEVVNNKIDTTNALKEDKMRLCIYDNINAENLYNLNKRLESIKNQVNGFESNISDFNTKLEKLKTDMTELTDKSIENIDNSFKASIKEIQNFTEDSIKRIERILSINPSNRKEILVELEKEYNCIDAFDESIPIKERYEKLLSLKDKTIYYHPKFNEVLKYVLVGNTVCLTGPSKCGKTKLAENLSNLLNLNFNNLGNVTDEITYIKGYYDFNTNYNKTTFQKLFENGGIVLIKNIDNSPIEVINTLNNIISNFKYNPYIFGDKLLTTPSNNFRLIMTNNNGLKIDKQDIDNLVTINLDYDTNFENSLSNDKSLLEFLHTLRNKGVNITTSTFIDIINHLNTGLFDIEELMTNYIIENNPIDLLKRKTEELNNDNRYNNTLKKILKG